MLKTFIRSAFLRMLPALMLLALLPIVTVSAAAATTLSGLSVSDLGASYEKTSTFGSQSWSGSGTTIEGSVTGHAGLFSDYAGTSQLTLTNNKSEEAILKFSYSVTANGGSVTVAGTKTGGGTYNQKIAAGASIAIILTSKKGNYKTSITITDLELTVPQSGVAVTFLPADEGGGYTVDGTELTASTTYTNDATKEYKLVATASTGYTFVGWYNVTDSKYLALEETHTGFFTSAVTVKPVFALSTIVMFEVGTQRFLDLNDANNYAVSSGDKKIILIQSGTLPKGNYTISSGKTLLIPFDAAHTLYTTTPGNTDTTYTKPTFYRTLTMSDGANITVNGAMSVSGKHCAKMGSNGLPSGPQGFVVMEKGSSITVNSGGNLYAWGYIVGEKRSANTETPKGGAVTIKNGGKVYECFQVTDYRGGSATSNMASSYGDNIKTYRVFPMSQYYIQNVQVPMTLEAGAAEIGYMSVTVTYLGVQSAPVPFIGSNGLFRINSGSITKNYDEQNDRLVIDINGDLTMSTMTINIKVGAFGTVDLDSSQYVLPMAGNMTVNLNSGSTVTLAQDLALIPGGVLNIAEGATLNVGTSSKSQNLYVYDKEQWGGYCYSSSVTYRPLDYAYDRFAKRTEASLVDAKILVNGTLDSTCGYVYTTSGGANICSTGTGMFKVGTLGTQTVTYQATQANTTVSYAEISIAPAQLHNGTNTANFAGPEYTLTKDAATATAYTYCIKCDMWVEGENGLVHIIENGEIMGHAKTLEEAKGDYGTPAAGKYIQMLANSNGETVAFADGTVLDLNGNTITGTGVSVSGTLYGMDSTSDGYGLPSGSITVSGGTVATVTDFDGKNTTEGSYTVNTHRYLAVQSGSAWQFHRFNISVTDYYLEVLSTGSASIGFGATFRGDSAVIAAVTDMGFTVNDADGAWAGKDNISLADQYKLYYTVDANTGDNTAFAMLKFDENTTQSSETRTVNFLSALKTYYDSMSDTQVKNVIDKFMTAAQLTWPST